MLNRLFRNNTVQYYYNVVFVREYAGKICNKCIYIGTGNTVDPHKFHVNYNRTLLVRMWYEEAWENDDINSFDPSKLNKSLVTDEQVYKMLETGGAEPLPLIARNTLKRESWIIEELDSLEIKPKVIGKRHE